MLNIFIKHNFKLEMFVAVGWSYDKWCILIVLLDPNTPGRVNTGVIVMKGYSTFPKAPEPEPNHQMQFNVISRTLVEGVKVT